MPVKFDEQEVDRIVADAADFFAMASPETRSVGRTASKITPLFVDLDGAATRSDGESAGEELFYAVDFDNDQGYALISADRRLPDEVLINVGNGSFPEGEIENPGLALMMVGAENYARREIARHEAWQDSVEMAMLEKFDGEIPEFEITEEIIEYPDSSDGSEPVTRAPGPIITREYGPWRITQVTPMIPVEWGQRGVFNKTVVENTKWDDTPAGCVAIAVAQLMAYWEHPTSLDDIYPTSLDNTIDWNELCRWSGRWSDYGHGYRDWSGLMSAASQQTQNMCANLIWCIGLAVSMNYGKDGSGAQNAEAINLLQGLGYNASYRENYKLTPVLNSLDNGRPVYMKGGSQQTLGLFPGIDGNHAWLIDGYLKRYREIKVTTTIVTDKPLPPVATRTNYTYTSVRYEYDDEKYLHNNFGWEGEDDGYYVAGIFDSNNGADLPSDTRAEDGNYQYNLRVWPNIYH